MTDFFVNGFASLTGDAAAEDFAPYFEPRRLRRMEGIAKNALLCSCRALEQARRDPLAPKDIGLSLAVGAGSLESTCKFMDGIIDDGDELASPTAFAGSVHNSTGLALSMFLRVNGPCVTTGQFDFSFAGALLSAREFLERGLCEEVLLAVADDVNPVVREMASMRPELFTPVLPNFQKPFVRAAAAFVLSQKPTEKTLFSVEHFLFSSAFASAKNGARAEYCTAARPALEAARLFGLGKPFSFQDAFGGAVLSWEAIPYAK